jgi:hypothetical protein
VEWYLLVVAIVCVVTTLGLFTVVSFAFHSYYNDSMSMAAFTLIIRPKGKG